MYRYFLTPLHKTMILSYRSLCACNLMFGLLLWRSTHYWHCLSLSACIIYILPNPFQLLIHLRSHNFSLLCCDELHATLWITCYHTHRQRCKHELLHCDQDVGEKEYASHQPYLYNMFHLCQLASCVLHVFSFSFLFFLSFLQESFSQEICFAN